MRSIFRNKYFSSTLFVRLFTSFMIVICLLIAFFIVAFYYLNHFFHQELVRYHTSNLNYTAGNYERNFAKIKVILANQYLNDQVLSLRKQASYQDDSHISYYNIQAISHQLANITSTNQELHIHDIFLVLRHFPKIINTEGISDDHLIFSKYLILPEDKQDFWRNQFESKHFFQIISTTTLNNFNNLPLINPMFSVIFKTSTIQDMYFVASVDAVDSFQNMHISHNDTLLVYDKDQLIYASSAPPFELADLPNQTGDDGYYYDKAHKMYIFYKTGGETHLTYVNLIPLHSVTAQIARLYWVLLLAVIAVILISVLLSVLFSMSFHHPVQTILHTLQNNHTATLPFQTGIKEFRRINDHFNLIKSNNRNLSKTQAYFNQMRNIKWNESSQTDMESLEQSYMLLLFQIHPKQPLDMERVSYNISELLKLEWSTRHQALTFQTEKDQLATIVFTDQPALIQATLTSIRRMIDHDADYYLFTIGVSAVRKSTAKLADSYDEALTLIKQRRLEDTSQLFDTLDAEPPELMITPQQAQQFYSYILSANIGETLHWIRLRFQQLQESDAYACHYYQLCEDIVVKTSQSLHSLQIQVKVLDESLPRMSFCLTAPALLAWVEQYMETALAHVQMKKDLTDSTMEFILKYIEEHYAEDLSLDLLADKLKITSSYLSTYFKDRTGINFKEHLNNIRMSRAEHLLLQTNMKIQDIAEQVGYRSLTPFMRMFKKTTGHTPSEYRRKHAD